MQTTWEKGRLYVCGGRKFLYYKDALEYARHLFNYTGIIAGIEATYTEGE